MAQGPNDRTVLYFDSGIYKVIGGDDTIWNNITTASVNALRFERSGADIFTLANQGELKVTPTGSATSPALDVQGHPANQDLVRVYDANVGEDVLKFTKTDTGASSWAVNMVLRNADTPTAADEALRLTHDVQSDTPNTSTKLLSLGHTGTGGASYTEKFKLTQGGAFHLLDTNGSADILWGTDGGGNIGTSGGAGRPDKIFAATQVFAGGSYLENQYLYIGPQTANNKHIVALQTGTSDPSIRWNESGSQWEISPDSSTWSAVGTSNVASWDDLYDLDQDLTIDGSPLAWTQTSTSGSALYVLRALGETSTTAPIVFIDNKVADAVDDQPALKVNCQQFRGSTDSYGIYSVYVQDDDTTTGRTGGTATSLFSAVSPNDLDTGGSYHAVGCHAAASTGNATAYGIYVNENFDYGVYSKSKAYVLESTATNFGNSENYAVSVETTSTGTGLLANDIFIGYRHEFTPDTDDSTSSYYYGFYTIGPASDYVPNYYGFYADGSGGTTAQNKIGYYASVDWDYGLYSGSPIIMIDPSVTSAFEGIKVDVTSTGSGANSIEGISVDLTGDSADTGTHTGVKTYVLTESSSAVNIVGHDITLADGGSTTGNYTGIDLTTGGNTSGTTYGLNVDGNWDYALYSLSSVFVNNDVSGGGVYSARVEADTSGMSGGTSSILELTQIDDGTSSSGPIFYGLQVSGDADSNIGTGAVAVNINANWGLGVVSAAPENRFWYSPSSSPSSAVELTHIKYTSPAAGTTAAIKGVDIEITADGDDSNSYAGVSVQASQNPAGASMYGVAVNRFWDWGVYSESPVYALERFASGSGEEYVAQFDAQADTAGAAASDRGWTIMTHAENAALDNGSNRFAAIRVTGTDNGGAAIYGLYFPTTDANATGSWPALEYGIYAEAGLHYLSTDFDGSTGSHLYLNTQNSSAVSSGGELVSISASMNATSGEGNFGITGVKVQTTDNQWNDHAYAFHAASTASGKWSSGLFAENTLAVHADVDISLVPGSNITDINTDGILNVETDNTTALGLGEIVYGGLRVYHTGNASDDAASQIYGAYVDADGTQGGLYYGYYAGGGCSYGVWCDEVGAGSILSGNGSIVSSNNTSKYENTSLSNALIYAETNSDGIDGSTDPNWYGIVSGYNHNSGDTNDANWFAFYAEAISGTEGSVTTIGYRAHSSLDIGFESYAPTNTFSRSDDLYSGSSPVVLVRNLDNDSTAGVTPALTLENAYSSTSSTVLSIDSAYDGGDSEDTRRAIVLANTSRNRRNLPIQHATAVGSTIEWYLNASDYLTTRARDYWICRSTSSGGYTVKVPLFLPHRSTLQQVYVAFYVSGTASGTESQRTRARVYRKAYNQSISGTEGYLAQSYLGTGTGTQYINLSSINHDIDARNNNFFLEIRGPTGGSRSTLWWLGGYYTYDITDLGAAPGY